MKSQKDLIENEGWDVLIILDSCRYDVFEELVGKYLDNYHLEKVVSTVPQIYWTSTFTRYYDVTFYSSNSWVSTGNVRGGALNKYFKNIVDVWYLGWDVSLGTVPPWNVNYYVMKNFTSDRKIISYLQPHGPWIGRHKLTVTSYSMIHLGVDVKLRPVIEKKGPEYMRQLYVDNLKLVLKYVSALLESLNGTVIITSDHGEYLGENGKYLHTPMDNSDILKVVPWCETWLN